MESVATEPKPQLAQSSDETQESRGPITRRSVLLGLGLVIFLATLSPYNDQRQNTYLIGNHLPVIVVFVIALLAVVVNPLLDLPRPTSAGTRAAGRLANYAVGYVLIGLAITLVQPLFAALNSATAASVFGVLRWSFISSFVGLSATHSGWWPAVAALVCLAVAVANPVNRTGRFRPSEMIVAISMMLVAAAFPGAGFLRYFESIIVMPVYYISTKPDFAPYVNLLPNWLVPSHDPNAPIVTNYFMGLDPRSGLSVWGTWGPWLAPLLSWMLFALPFFLAIMFVCALMRKQWVQHERLAFPLAAIPLEMMAAPAPGKRINSLWRNRLLWVGALIPLLIHLNNGLQKFYPNMMVIPIDPVQNLGTSFSEFPWNQLDWSIKTPRIYFAIIGVTYFVPLEIAFSIWFMFIAYSVGEVSYKAAGVNVSNDNKLYQAIGSYLVYGTMLIWIARHHLRHVARSLFKKREPDEYLPYGVAVGGLVLCTAVAVAFLTFAGMLWWTALLTFLLMLLWAMILARIVMEAGVLFIQVPMVTADPLHTMGLLFGGAVSSKLNWLLTSATVKMGLIDPREQLMPFAANAARMGSGIERRSKTRFFVLLIGAILLCLLVSGVTQHVLSYTYGRQSWNDGFASASVPQTTVQQAQEIADPAAPPTINRPLNVAYGAIAMGAITLGRFMMNNFPLHPIGLLLLNSYPVRMMWFSILIAWALKWAILRWGGARTFSKARPFFIGLLVGDSLAAVVWIIVGLLVKWPTTSYHVLPG